MSFVEVFCWIGDLGFLDSIVLVVGELNLSRSEDFELGFVEFDDLDVELSFLIRFFVEIDGGEDDDDVVEFDVGFLGFLNWVLVELEVGVADLVELEVLGLMSLV